MSEETIRVVVSRRQEQGHGVVVLDMAPMLNKRKFKALQDAGLFVAVKAEEGGVLWGQGIQLAPEELWDRSRPC